MERFSRAMRAGPVLVRLPGFFNACSMRATRAICARLWRIVPKNMPLQRLHPIEAPAAAEKSCTRQALSGRPFYRAKMPSTATPVVHGNRPACRMLQGWMTALGGRGEAQSALLAYGGHETGPAVCRRLFTRSGYTFDRLACNLKAPAAAEKPCANQELSSKPIYRAKMPSTATPVVHGNRPAARMLQNWMTALGGRGEAQSALLAYGGHETGPAVYRGLSTRSGYAFDRLSFEISLPTFGQDRK
jgi:hypothetical protein